MTSRETLLSLGAETLAEIILALQEDNEIREKVEANVAAVTRDPNDLVKVIKERFTTFEEEYEDFNVSKEDFFVSSWNWSPPSEYEYDEKIQNIVKDLTYTRLLIVNKMLKKSPKKAFELMSQFLYLFDAIQNVDDDDGEVRELYREACSDIVKISNHFEQSQSDIVNLIFNMFISKDSYGSKTIIDEFKSFLNSENYLMLRRKFEDYTADSDIRSQGLKRIADIKDDVDAFISACNINESVSDHEIRAIVKRLTKHNRHDEALSWMDRIKENDGCYLDQDTTTKIMLYDLMGQPQKAQEIRVARFKKSLSVNHYNDILRHGDQTFISSFKEEAGMLALKHSSLQEAIDFLTQIANTKYLSELVLAKHSFLRENCTKLKSAAVILKDNYPLSATLIYRHLINSMLNSARYQEYDFGARYIHECAILSKKIGNWGSLPNHDAYILSLKRNHKGKKKFWSTLKNAAF